ncbi:hypothetical protein QO002_001735 [Pararhizobium capsulatum DSM 1112]|uniref:Uncharacterized protein n=1 Tax=Pararhizobium capsulatum DSM 1112 TaxID=1121113 RepID=A0ABU0BRU4_9HYPH|nr:hypothetical protein [Pararhizobium capsulatum DSM 1112]
MVAAVFSDWVLPVFCMQHLLQEKQCHIAATFLSHLESEVNQGIKQFKRLKLIKSIRTLRMVKVGAGVSTEGLLGLGAISRSLSLRCISTSKRHHTSERYTPPLTGLSGERCSWSRKHAGGLHGLY